MNAKSRAVLRLLGAVPDIHNAEYVEAGAESEPPSPPTASGFDGGARQSVPLPTDPARDHAELILASVGPKMARRSGRGGWDLG